MMNRFSLRSIIGILGSVLFLFAMWRFKALVAYLLVSVALSFVGRPVVLLFQRIKIKGRSLPSAIGASVALLLLLSTAIGLTHLFAPLFADQSKAIQSMDLQQIKWVTGESIKWIDDDLSQVNLSGDDRTNSEFLLQSLQDFIQVDSIGNLFSGLLSKLGDGFFALFSILFMTFFFLKDGALFRNMIEAVTPDELVPKMSSILTRTSKLLTRYFGGLIIQVIITTSIVSIGLGIVGAEHAFLIGFLAGIFNLVPYVGPLAGAGVGLVLVISTFAGSSEDVSVAVFGTLGVFAIAQLVDNFFTQPVVFANSVHAHPLEIFIVISIAGSLAGVTGMVLAIPTYTLFRIVGQELFSGFKLIDRLTKNLK